MNNIHRIPPFIENNPEEEQRQLKTRAYIITSHQKKEAGLNISYQPFQQQNCPGQLEFPTAGQLSFPAPPQNYMPG